MPRVIEVFEVVHGSQRLRLNLEEVPAAGDGWVFRFYVNDKKTMDKDLDKGMCLNKLEYYVKTFIIDKINTVLKPDEEPLPDWVAAAVNELKTYRLDGNQFTK